KPLIQRFLYDDRETARDYTELAVLTEDYADGHPEYEYYVWTDVTPQTYQKQAERLKSYTQLDELDVTKTFKKVTAPVTPQRADRGFGVTIPARHTGRCLPKKKKPTKEEPVVTKPKPVVCATCDIEEITVTLAKVTLHVEPMQTPPEPVITAKANLRYAMNVLRWRPSYLQHDDPIKSDTKYHHKSYTPRDRLWIYIKHNFATIVDDFLHLGVYEKDPKKLEFYNAVRRLQLVGDITIQQGRRKDRKVGVFTFTEGHDGTWKHRYFTIKSKAEEIIDQTYAEKGWKLLENPKEQAKDGQKPDLLAKDGSFVEYQSENMIIIRDPKNRNALIRIVPNRA
ncbi:MAG: hypothetical protein JSS12_10095, partial [Verrucomicrobia bacterium]|nr:hypothetical protein [Verrucomicrobiota bacterium]